MTDKFSDRIVALLCVAVSIFTYSLWPFFGKGLFYKGLAIHFICSYVMLLSLSVFPRKDKFIQDCAFTGLLLAINNLVDELFFDPTKIEINEYVTLILIVCYILLKRLKNARSA